MMKDARYMSLDERLEYVRNQKIRKYVLRCLSVVGITVGMLVVLILSVLLIVNYGPSENAHKVFVKSVRETSALGFLADWFTSPEELEQILIENTIEELDTVTDTSLIQIPSPGAGNGSNGTGTGTESGTDNESGSGTGEGTSGGTGAEGSGDETISGEEGTGEQSSENGSDDGTGSGSGNETDSETGSVNETGSGDSGNAGENQTTGGMGYTAEDVILDENGIIICEVSGTTYKGHMMIVQDPSRVKVGVCDNLGSSSANGQKLSTIIDKYGAVAGINAGGFADENGSGSGAIPYGYVFSEGEFLYNSGESNLLIGFDSNNILNVGNIDAETAKAKGIRDAVTFGPALIINGQAAGINGAGSGLNPRTAIGQRSDGAVLLLVVDGRQANSLGASYGDLIEIMQKFGAVNAANLDGGSSSLMMYEGEQISSPANLINNRDLPTAIIVM
ncbi:MAG: phosphodiester glycosidase family protein [Lachnospiraceae bacterium]|nr:phosphodiester glycosidase family protein [Lachnospiraceae bacterium]